MKTVILLLAAGESRRLGQPKQLLPFRGTTLLRHAVATALAANLGPVLVVLGPHEAACRETLAGLPAGIVVNPDFCEGMGTSIAAGVRGLAADPPDAVIIALCDQPKITAPTFRALQAEHERTGATIVAARCGDTLGPPALFAPTHFPRLQQLTGHTGAKSVFAAAPVLAAIDCPEAAFDIDTAVDLKALLGTSPSLATDAPALT